MAVGLGAFIVACSVLITLGFIDRARVHKKEAAQREIERNRTDTPKRRATDEIKAPLHA
jgi:hypothetical protein